MEMEEQWTTSHRYLTMEAYWLWRQQRHHALKGRCRYVQRRLITFPTRGSLFTDDLRLDLT